MAISYECVDRYDNCAEYEQIDQFCSSDAPIEYKRFFCQKTCNLCPESTTSEAITEIFSKSTARAPSTEDLETSSANTEYIETTTSPELWFVSTVNDYISTTAVPSTETSETSSSTEELITTAIPSQFSTEKPWWTTEDFVDFATTWRSEWTDVPSREIRSSTESSFTETTRETTTGYYDSSDKYTASEEKEEHTHSTRSVIIAETSYPGDTLYDEETTTVANNQTNETDSALCHDDYENCERFNLRYDFCASDASIEFKRFVCAKTCGVCVEPTTTTTTTSKRPTTSTSTEQPETSTVIQTTHSTTPVTTARVCDDDYENCAAFDKRYNFCASDASVEYKRFVCEKTCHMCKTFDAAIETNSTTSVQPIASTELPVTEPQMTTERTTPTNILTEQLPITKPVEKCYDKLGLLSCIFQDKAYGFCKNYGADSTEILCSMTCGHCQPAIPQPTEHECLDYLDELNLNPHDNTTCAYWIQEKVCDQHWYSHKAALYCKKSCGLC